LSVESSGTNPDNNVDKALHYGMQVANVVSLVDIPVALANWARMGLNGLRALRGAEAAKDGLEAAGALRAGRAAVESAVGEWQAVNETMSARAAAYQTQVTGRTGQAFVVNGVKFDGVAMQGLIDAKGPGYAAFVRNGEFQPWFNGADDLLSQARRQLAAANGTPITWHVAEAEAATAIENLLQSRGVQGVTVVHTPPVP
jgi:filamentous hemagglutinin